VPDRFWPPVIEFVQAAERPRFPPLGDEDPRRVRLDSRFR
jgi:hypothetical protein